jgi:alkanesulfonate monooxygenase SsuD/methylene tetrahydromethanopterin reductase-like flavin-dependent oxidoreductase (luciferase family)
VEVIVDIGIGLPNAVNGTTGHQLLDWATKADTAGFSSVASIGAVSYPSHEELTVFGAVAAVTRRVRMLTNVLIAPARSSAELAKQAATVDQLSNGRLTLGLGVGWRQSDYTVTGRDFDQRGAAFDRQLTDLRRAWAGETLAPDTREVSPPPVQNPIPIIVGGTTDAAVRRVVQHGIGWTAGGMPPDAVGGFVDKLRAAWSDAGRSGSPRITALAYFGLGDTAEESRRNLLHYYEPMGAEIATMIADNALRTDDAVSGAIKEYADVGVDELILDASVSDPAQVDLLAEVVFG